MLLLFPRVSVLVVVGSVLSGCVKPETNWICWGILRELGAAAAIEDDDELEDEEDEDEEEELRLQSLISMGNSLEGVLR